MTQRVDPLGTRAHECEMSLLLVSGGCMVRFTASPVSSFYQLLGGVLSSPTFSVDSSVPPSRSVNICFLYFGALFCEFRCVTSFGLAMK